MTTGAALKQFTPDGVLQLPSGAIIYIYVLSFSE